MRTLSQLKTMKLQDHDEPNDKRDKVIIIVRHLKRTPKGFREQGSCSLEWRSDSSQAREEYIRAAKQVTNNESVFRAMMFEDQPETKVKGTGRPK